MRMLHFHDRSGNALPTREIRLMVGNECISEQLVKFSGSKETRDDTINTYNEEEVLCMF